MVITSLYFLTLLPFAAFFGIAVYMVIAPVYDELSAAAFIEFFQKLDPYMKVWARVLLLAELVLTIALLVLQHRTLFAPAGLLTILAFAFALGSLVVAVRGNVPLNRQMDHWNPLEPPAGWTEIRDRWLSFHRLRGAFETAGFLCLLAAAFFHASQT